MKVVYVEPDIKEQIDKEIEKANVADREINYIQLLTWEWDELLEFFEKHNGIRHDRLAPFYYRGVMLTGMVSEDA